jgi:hypothetical protein
MPGWSNRPHLRDNDAVDDAAKGSLIPESPWLVSSVSLARSARWDRCAGYDGYKIRERAASAVQRPWRDIERRCRK